MWRIINKKTAFLCLSFLCSICFIPFLVNASKLTEIDGKTLEGMLLDGKPIIIVDVREPNEFATGHIKGAINLPFQEAKLNILSKFSRIDRIVFVCHKGPMGHELGMILIKNNYPEVYNLLGGMKQWKGTIVK